MYCVDDEMMMTDNYSLKKKEKTVLSLPMHATTLINIKEHNEIIDIFISLTNLENYDGKINVKRVG